MKKSANRLTKLLVGLLICVATVFGGANLAGTTATAKTGVSSSTEKGGCFPVTISTNANNFNNKSMGAYGSSMPYLIGSREYYVDIGATYTRYKVAVLETPLMNSDVKKSNLYAYTTVTETADNETFTYIDGLGFTAYSAEYGDGTTYKSGTDTIGVTTVSEFDSGTAKEAFATGVLSSSALSQELLAQSSIYFQPYSDNLDEGFEILSKCTYNGTTYWFALVSNSSRKNDSETVVNSLYWEQVENRTDREETLWHMELKDDETGEYWIYTRKDKVYYVEDSGKVTTINNGYMYLDFDYAVDAGGNQTARRLIARSAGSTDRDELFVAEGSDGDGSTVYPYCMNTLVLFGNLSMIKGDPQYDAFRLVDGDKTYNIVTKNGSSVALPTSSASGTLLTWQRDRLANYTREFEDYTYDFGTNDSYLAYLDKHKSTAVPTSYNGGATLAVEKYTGKTFYANRQFKLNYSVMGLATGDSLQVRTGTLSSYSIYASETDVKSGTLVSSGNWVSMAVPSKNQSGYNYSISFVLPYDSEGTYLKKFNYETKTLSNGAECICFEMPNHDITIKLELEKTAVPVTSSGYGYFVTNDSSKYASSLSANMYTPFDLTLSTTAKDSQGYDFITIYTYNEWENEFYVRDVDGFASGYRIASAKWFIKVGDSDTFQDLGSSGTGETTSTLAGLYLPCVTEETKITYKCTYTVKHPATGATSGEKSFQLTATVKPSTEVPDNYFYIYYQYDGGDYYTSGQTYNTSTKLMLYANLYADYPDTSSIFGISDYGRMCIASVSDFTYSFTWYIASTDGKSGDIQLNYTPVTVTPDSAGNLVAKFDCSVPRLLSQGSTDAKIYCKVVKTNKTTGDSRTITSYESATLTVKYDVAVQILDYDHALTYHLEVDNIYIEAVNLTKWEYSTDNGLTWTEISIANTSDGYSLDYYAKSPASIIISFARKGISHEGSNDGEYKIYSFAVKTPGVYIFRMTNVAGSVNYETLDFTHLHTHIWSDPTYNDKTYHVQKCTVDGCGAYKQFGSFSGQAHTKNANGECIYCQDGDILLYLDLDGGECRTGYTLPTGYKDGSTPALPTVKNIKKAGYAFVGWEFDETNSTDVAKYYKAKWTAKVYTLKNSVTNETKTGLSGDYVVLTDVTNPTSEGWEFVGWRCNSMTFRGLISATDTLGDIDDTNDINISLIIKPSYRDIEPPEAKITIGDREWTTLSDSLDEVLYFDTSVSGSFTGEDNSHSIAKYNYYIANKVMTAEELSGIWCFDSLNFTMERDGTYYVYVLIEDEEGLQTIVSTCRIVVDKTAPVLDGIADGEKYCETTKVTVTEPNLASVMLNGNSVTLDGDGTLTLTPASDAQTLTVTDLLGHVTTVTVTIGHTAGEWVIDTEPTCTTVGAMHKACMTCGAVLEIEGIPTVEHTYGEWVDEIPASVEKEGTKAHKDCTACGKHFDGNGNELTDLTIAKLQKTETESDTDNDNGGQPSDSTETEETTGKKKSGCKANVTSMLVTLLLPALALWFVRKRKDN